MYVGILSACVCVLCLSVKWKQGEEREERRKKEEAATITYNVYNDSVKNITCRHVCVTSKTAWLCRQHCMWLFMCCAVYACVFPAHHTHTLLCFLPLPHYLLFPLHTPLPKKKGIWINGMASSSMPSNSSLPHFWTDFSCHLPKIWLFGMATAFTCHAVSGAGAGAAAGLGCVIGGGYVGKIFELLPLGAKTLLPSPGDKRTWWERQERRKPHHCYNSK